MELVGMIVAAADPPGIDQSKWIQLIKDREELVAPHAREVKNPFTGKPTLVQPHPAAANVIVDGNHIGSIYWSMDDGNYLIVDGEQDRVVPFAIEIANELNGTFQLYESK